jgi:equilibrative nucleoside transporter 1/2/3
VLVNAFLQAGVGSYLQPSVVGTSALFGPTAVQAFGSGQAAVAVVVSGVQFLSAASSLSAAPKDGVFATGDGKAEESSAFVFFGLSTIFMVATTGAHAWLTTMPAYKSAVGRLLKERAGLYVVAAGETQGLVSQRQTSVDDKKRNDRDRLRRVAKANALFEVAMCYVFAVTLVRLQSVGGGASNLSLLASLSSHRLLPSSNPRTPRFTLYCSAPFISSSSISETS